MEPIDYLVALRRRWIAIIVCVVLGALIGAAYSRTIPNSYRASSSVFVTAQQDGNAQSAFAGNQYSVAAVQSFVRLASLPAVLDPVIQRLGLNESTPQLAKQLTVSSQTDTVLIDISATAPTPSRAAAIAQAVAESLVDQARVLAPKSGGKPILSMRVVAAAQRPSAPFAPNRNSYIAIGAALALLLGVLYALARFLLATRITSESDLARVTQHPLLGAIGRFPKRAGIVMRSQPRSTTAEDYRRLRTNLEFAGVDGSARVVVVTSALPGDGKSMTSINLAMAMAEADRHVLLIDADLRKPSVAEYTGLEGGVGLTSVLLERATFAEAVQQWGAPTLDVLPAGAVPPNPNQIVASAAMRDLVSRLREDYDLIVIDSPPLIPVPDSLALAELADGAILVARNERTRRTDLARAVESLELVHERILGVVLNETANPGRKAYKGYEAEGATRSAKSTIISGTTPRTLRRWPGSRTRRSTTEPPESAPLSA